MEVVRARRGHRSTSCGVNDNASTRNGISGSRHSVAGAARGWGGIRETLGIVPTGSRGPAFAWRLRHGKGGVQIWGRRGSSRYGNRGWTTKFTEHQLMQRLVAAKEQECQNAQDQSGQHSDSKIPKAKATAARSLHFVRARAGFRNPGILAAGRTGEPLRLEIFDLGNLAAMDATMFHAAVNFAPGCVRLHAHPLAVSFGLATVPSRIGIRV